jgi:two-component system LytT family response regulator
MALKCVVIDDEQYAADALAKYVEEMPNLMLFKTFTNPLVALAGINETDQIDFIFLDIEMPSLSGLELAKDLRNKCKFLVFTTSHSKYALTAFEVQANQYLLKPITFAKFALTINSLLKNNEVILPSAHAQNKHLKFIKADQKNAYHYLNANEIISVQAAKNYVIISTATEKFMTHLGLNHIEAVLSTNEFIRIGKSYIIAKNEIRKIEGNQIKLKNNEVFQVGDTYKPAFLKFVKENMLST